MKAAKAGYLKARIQPTLPPLDCGIVFALFPHPPRFCVRNLPITICLTLRTTTMSLWSAPGLVNIKFYSNWYNLVASPFPAWHNHLTKLWGNILGQPRNLPNFRQSPMSAPSCEPCDEPSSPATVGFIILGFNDVLSVDGIGADAAAALCPRQDDDVRLSFRLFLRRSSRGRPPPLWPFRWTL